jgi:hypothetical protein
MMLLGTNSELRRRIGMAARHTASQRFDVSITASLLREAIQKAVTAAPKKGENERVIE